MNEKDVTYFSTLLGIEADAVEGLVTDGLLGAKVAEAVMAKDKVDKLKENLAKSVRDEYFDELVEKAKTGEVPPDLYKPIHGAVSEKLEKKLSKEYAVDQYKNLDDLLAQLITKGQSNNPQLEELQVKIKALQDANTTLQSERDEAEKRIRGEFESQIIERDLNDHLSKIPFDLSGVEDKEMENTLAQRKLILKSVFDNSYSVKYQDGNIVVVNRDGEVVKDQATLDPVPVSDVFRSVANTAGIALESPETGGQGGSSYKKNGSRFANVDEFYEYCRKNDIPPESPEATKIRHDAGLKII